MKIKRDVFCLLISLLLYPSLLSQVGPSIHSIKTPQVAEVGRSISVEVEYDLPPKFKHAQIRFWLEVTNRIRREKVRIRLFDKTFELRRGQKEFKLEIPMSSLLWGGELAAQVVCDGKKSKVFRSRLSLVKIKEVKFPSIIPLGKTCFVFLSFEGGASWSHLLLIEEVTGKEVLHIRKRNNVIMFGGHHRLVERRCENAIPVRLPQIAEGRKYRWVVFLSNSYKDSFREDLPHRFSRPFRPKRKEGVKRLRSRWLKRLSPSEMGRLRGWDLLPFCGARSISLGSKGDIWCGSYVWGYEVFKSEDEGDTWPHLEGFWGRGGFFDIFITARGTVLISPAAGYGGPGLWRFEAVNGEWEYVLKLNWKKEGWVRSFSQSPEGAIYCTTSGGEYSRVYKSVDDGRSWGAVLEVRTGEERAERFNKNPVVCGEEGLVAVALSNKELYLSYDHGRTWVKKRGIPGMPSSMALLSPDELVLAAGGYGGAIYILKGVQTKDPQRMFFFEISSEFSGPFSLVKGGRLEGASDVAVDKHGGIFSSHGQTAAFILDKGRIFLPLSHRVWGHMSELFRPFALDRRRGILYLGHCQVVVSSFGGPFLSGGRLIRIRELPPEEWPKSLYKFSTLAHVSLEERKTFDGSKGILRRIADVRDYPEHVLYLINTHNVPVKFELVVEGREALSGEVEAKEAKHFRIEGKKGFAFLRAEALGRASEGIFRAFLWSYNPSLRAENKTVFEKEVLVLPFDDVKVISIEPTKGVVYCATRKGSIYKSMDRGETWELFKSESQPPKGKIEGLWHTEQGALFLSISKKSPFRGLWKYEPVSGSWRRVFDEDRGVIRDLSETRAGVFFFSVSECEPARVYRSADVGESWQKILQVEGTNLSRRRPVLAGLNDFGGDYVYLFIDRRDGTTSCFNSWDFGTTWWSREKALPSSPVAVYFGGSWGSFPMMTEERGVWLVECVDLRRKERVVSHLFMPLRGRRGIDMFTTEYGNIIAVFEKSVYLLGGNQKLVVKLHESSKDFIVGVDHREGWIYIVEGNKFIRIKDRPYFAWLKHKSPKSFWLAEGVKFRKEGERFIGRNYGEAPRAKVADVREYAHHTLVVENTHDAPILIRVHISFNARGEPSFVMKEFEVPAKRKKRVNFTFSGFCFISAEAIRKASEGELRAFLLSK